MERKNIEQQAESTGFEALFDNLVLKIMNHEITIAQVEFAIGQAVEEMKAETFEDVFDYYKASIGLGKTTIEEVETHLMRK